MEKMTKPSSTVSKYVGAITKKGARVIVSWPVWKRDKSTMGTVVCFAPSLDEAKRAMARTF